MAIKKVLFHTRLREFSFNALKLVLDLKKTGLQEIVLTYIIPYEEVAYVPYGGYLKEKEEQIRAEVRTRFQDWQKSLSALGIEAKCRIATGAANAEILSIAAEEHVDLIVTGRKHRTPFEKVYVGSHVLDILRRSDVPVLMGKYMVQFEADGEIHTHVNEQIFKRPMIATDWSGPSANTLQTLFSLQGLAEKILIIHVVDSKLSKGLDAAALEALKAESRRRLQACEQDAQAAGFAAEFHLGMGKTVPEIMRLSREHGATLIALGRTGKDWFEEYWLGGVTHRVAELSELPVMIVP